MFTKLAQIFSEDDGGVALLQRQNSQCDPTEPTWMSDFGRSVSENVANV